VGTPQAIVLNELHFEMSVVSGAAGSADAAARSNSPSPTRSFRTCALGFSRVIAGAALSALETAETIS
jgi:hypothetical protein